MLTSKYTDCQIIHYQLFRYYAKTIAVIQKQSQSYPKILLKKDQIVTDHWKRNALLLHFFSKRSCATAPKKEALSCLLCATGLQQRISAHANLKEHSRQIFPH